jgi:hypothetical protein
VEPLDFSAKALICLCPTVNSAQVGLNWATSIPIRHIFIIGGGEALRRNTIGFAIVLPAFIIYRARRYSPSAPRVTEKAASVGALFIFVFVDQLESAL